jgi:PAS domain S-box-containing protein
MKDLAKVTTPPSAVPPPATARITMPADADTTQRVTVQDCEDEPIRIPGSVQRHGFLLLLDESNEHVVAASENAEEFLGVPLKLILGTTVETVLPREVLIAVRSLSLLSEPVGLLTYLGSFPMRGELYSVITHLVKNERVIEFEQLDRLVSPELMNAVITNFVGKLSKLTTQMELCRLITKQVKDLTGFNRILLYSFDDAGHGTVLTEDNDGVLPSCLDLRFPSSDIPQQARDLYVLNTVRIIPNADYVPSPLKGSAGRQMAGLDLSTSILRSVSPIHLEYMRNMGTLSSMSISIVCDGKLWGLISGHHATPHRVPYLVRSACDLLTKMVGTQLTAFRTTSKLARMVHFHSVHRRALTLMAAEKDYIAAMAEQIDYLMQVVGAEGVALVVEGQCELGGETPGEATVLKLATWMDDRPDLKLFETNQSRRDIKWDEEIPTEASGLLIIRISDVRSSYLMWFRPEVERTVKWAGQPTKTMDDSGILHPRHSFGMWKELVRGQSIPWTEVEIESAREFRSAVMTISLKRAEEAAELSEARFKQLTHALPNLVWTADDDGQLTYVNQKWREEGLGDRGRWWEQGQLNADDQKRSRELWDQAVLENSPFEAELRFQLGNEASGRWNLVRAIPFLRVNQSRAGWVGTCTDLTDRRERELALRMTEKLALTGRMTSVIAHEINNPLEAITNLLYLLGSEVPDHGPARDYIGMAESELERISGITKQTLRWSRESVQPRVFGTAGVVFEEVLRLFAGKIRNRQVTVTVRGGEDTVFFGVVGQVRQVIANLLSNAVDAVPVGGSVWLEAIPASASSEMMEIVVGDEGPGMTDEVRRQLFQPFYSTKGDLGNGLGLYISKEIVERLKGHLILDTKIDIGTVVRVRLPALED